MRSIQSFDIGPFNSLEAEWLTERALESKDATIAFEQFFRGDISAAQFLTSFQYLIESMHDAYQAEQREMDVVSYE